VKGGTSYAEEKSSEEEKEGTASEGAEAGERGVLGGLDGGEDGAEGDASGLGGGGDGIAGGASGKGRKEISSTG
jgi:hypothetical protein